MGSRKRVSPIERVRKNLRLKIAKGTRAQIRNDRSHEGTNPTRLRRTHTPSEIPIVLNDEVLKTLEGAIL